MKPIQILGTKKFLNVAICAVATLLCASCATNTRDETEKRSPKELGQLYVDLGTQALLRGEYPQAVEDLRKAVTVDSKNATSYNHLGLAYYALGKKQLAKENILKATDVDPNYSDAYINLGNFAFDENNLTLAKKYYSKALDNLEYKYRHRALTNLAQVHLKENNIDEARKLLYQSLQANSDYCMSHFLLGSIFTRENNPRRAAEEFKKSVVSTCTSNVEAHYQLGLAYMRAKDFDKAKRQMVHLMEQFPQSIQAQKAGDHLKNIP